MTMRRRGFFKSLVKAAAIVALAPQIAFRVKPIKVAVEVVQKVEAVPSFWYQTTRETICTDEAYRKAWIRLCGSDHLPLDPEYKKALEAWFA